MREQVEALEDEADAGAVLGHLAIAERGIAAGPSGHAEWHAVDQHLAARRPLQEIDAAQQRRLARAARPDQGDALAARHAEVDALEHVEIAVALPESGDL